jgi:hypothetical protein
MQRRLKKLRFAWPCVLAILLVALTRPDGAAAGDLVGFVKTVEGSAFVLRQGQSLAVSQGIEVMAGDIVQTGSQSALGIIFADDTLVSLGPETQMAIDNYSFKPRQKQLSFVARVLQGTISFISGQLTKLSPESVQIVVPSGTIGVRGTHVLVKVDH